MINECFLMCYFMNFDPISSRIYGVFSALFLVGFGGVFRGHFLLVKLLFKAYLHSLVLFATFLLILLSFP